MATQQVFENHVPQQPRNYSNIYLDFLEAVRNRPEEDVRCLLPISSNYPRRRMDNEEGDEDDLSQKQKLLKALESKDPVEVWKLIAETKDSDVKTLESLNEICQSVAEHERLKEEGLIRCLWGKLRGQIRCTVGYGTSGINHHEDKEIQTEFQHEQEQQWIRILSDPLYIGLEWLWRNNPNIRRISTSTQQTKRKDNKFEDIIETCLDDAYLLEKIALFEHHYSRDEYMNRALGYEKFAADVVEGSNLDQLHEILDVEGSGCLLQKKPMNFNQSLSLLKIAADKERKKFVTSPKCQSVLNEIVYYEWPHWQNMSCLTKMAWFFFQLIFVAVSFIFYMPVRLALKLPCCDKDDSIWWRFREKYEHPYSKFINHTMWYLVFLFFIFSTSFEKEFGTTETGLAWLDYPVIVFVLGLLLQESLEARRQGFFIYMSKWWNVVDTLIIVTFLTAYAVWLLAWIYYHEKWMPRKSPFVIADVLYASATVVAYFHLTHIFQVDTVLGPLQLSLYKMLKDVRRFLFIFLLLYISFVTGVVKVYSYYVASQMELQKMNDSYFEESHPYTNHVNASIGLFWMLFGVVEEEKISVQDPDFVLIATFGRLFLMAYMVCTVIVALNMLVAMMNNSFDRIMENADMEWKFSRARMWLEWIDKGNTMPAPLNIAYYILHLVVVRFCGKCLGLIKEKCPCCEGNKDEEMQDVNRKRDEATVRKEKRKEIMKDLVVKYLQDRYFGNSVAESNMEDKTGENTESTERGGKHPKNIDDNINLLKRLVDRQTKELAELRKKIDSISDKHSNISSSL